MKSGGRLAVLLRDSSPPEKRFRYDSYVGCGALEQLRTR